MRRIYRVGFLFAGAVIATPALAQDQTVEEATALDRILVTAGQEKVAIKTPQAVSVVDQEDLENAQPDTIGDAIEDLPGVTAIGSERVLGESFNIRGIGGASTADEPRLIVNIDGTPKYFEQYRMGSLFTEPELYKRIEVLRGPASSTLYGSGAIGGVINLETKDPSDFLTDEKSWALRQKFGVIVDNGAGFKTSTIGAWRPTEGAEFLLNGVYKAAGQYQDGDGEKVEGTNYETFSGLAKGVFTFGPDDAHRIEASYSRFETEQDDAPYSQTELQSVFGTVDREVTDQTAQVSWNYAPVENTLIDLTVTGSYSYTLNEQSDTSVPFVAAVFGDSSDTSYETYQLRVENVAELHSSALENYLTTGVQIAFQDRVAEAYDAGGAPLALSFHPEGEQLSLGGYVQLESVYDGWLTLIPGVRVDQVGMEAGSDVASTVTVRDNDYTLFSPKLAVHAQATEWLGLFGSIAHTQRAPVMDELYDGGSAPVGELKKEKSNNYEAGFALSFGDADSAFKLKTTGFYNDIEDLIDRDSQTDPYRNLPGARIHGVEVEAAYETRYLFGRAAYSLIRGQVDDGEDLDTIPADELTLTVGGRLPENGFELGWTGHFADGQDRSSSPSDGYVVHDLYASWKPEDGVLENTEFRASVENVFDRTYKPHLALSDNSPGMTAKFSIAQQF